MNRLILSNGYEIEYQQLSNIAVYQYIAKLNLTKPIIPKYYIESQDRYEENQFHPNYNEAMQAYEIKKGSCAIDFMILNGIKNQHKTSDITIGIFTENPKIIYFKYNIITEKKDLESLIDSIFLTEKRVYDIFNLIEVKRNGQDIKIAPIKNQLNINIEYQPLYVSNQQLVNPLDEYNACLESGLDYSKWMRNEYTLDEMASTVALYRLNNLIKNHAEDQAAIEAERKSKKK